MALHDFWSNVRIAARYFAPQAIVDSPRLDTEAIERMLREQIHWMSPGAVAGFDEQEFSFLADGERSRLAMLVADLRAVASSQSPTASVADDAVEKALPIFRDIVQLLEFDRYGDVEAYRLGKMIEQEIAPRKPPELAELRFNTGLDHSGDPAVWIWAFLTEDVSRNDDTFLKAAHRLRAVLHHVARRVAPDRLPYLSFRPVSEPAEAVEVP
jgi:hypothetical protein